MNLPTLLTIMRIILVAPVMICIFMDDSSAQITTVVCFVVAGATDFVDGRLARAKRQVTDLGAFLDPLADKMLVNLTFLALVMKGLMPLWMFAIILIRDFMVDGVRMMAAKKGVTLSANKLGKLKTMLQMLTITLILLNVMFLNHNLEIFNLILLYIVIMLTAISGVEIIVQGKRQAKIF